MLPPYSRACPITQIIFWGQVFELVFFFNSTWNHFHFCHPISEQNQKYSLEWFRPKRSRVRVQYTSPNSGILKCETGLKNSFEQDSLKLGVSQLRYFGGNWLWLCRWFGCNWDVGRGRLAHHPPPLFFSDNTRAPKLCKLYFSDILLCISLILQQTIFDQSPLSLILGNTLGARRGQYSFLWDLWARGWGREKAKNGCDRRHTLNGFDCRGLHGSAIFLMVLIIWVCVLHCWWMDMVEMMMMMSMMLMMMMMVMNHWWWW